MKQIDDTDKHIAMDIITHAFRDNPNLLWFMKKDNNIDKRLRVLCEYCLETSMQKKGAFISSDQLGVLLAYKSESKLTLLSMLKLYIKLIHSCIGWNRLPSVLYRQYCLGKLKPTEKHIYCLMLAVKNNTHGMNTVFELKNGLYEMSKKQNLTVYAETSLEKNKTIYERFGFITHNAFKMRRSDFTIWFLKRNPV